MHVRVFFEGDGTEWGIFLGVGKISYIILGCLKLLIFLCVCVGGGGRCWAWAYV